MGDLLKSTIDSLEKIEEENKKNNYKKFLKILENKDVEKLKQIPATSFKNSLIFYYLTIRSK